MIQTTFYQDFTIADQFGMGAIQDTFNRAFDEWKKDFKYLTALVICLNHKIWEYYEKEHAVSGLQQKKVFHAISELYDKLWKEADAYACDNLKGEELDYFYRETD